MARALYTAESGMPRAQKKPTITILYDAQEKSVRKEELAEGKKVPELVSTQIEKVLNKRDYAVKVLAAEAPIKRLVRQLEDDNSELICKICKAFGGAPD